MREWMCENVIHAVLVMGKILSRAQFFCQPKQTLKILKKEKKLKEYFKIVYSISLMYFLHSEQ